VSHAGPHRQLPLSQSLAAILADGPASGGMTINRLLEKTQGRGLYLVIMVLCLPFVVPVSVPGMSVVLGSIVAILSFSLVLGLQPRLPRFIGERPLPPGLQQRLLGGSVRFLRFLERGIKPRQTRWMGWRWARNTNALLITFMALLLALPLPTPPFFFSNSIPSYAIILLAASMMEEDGIMIWAGYAMVIVNGVFFGLIAEVLTGVLVKLWHALRGVGGS
jgi:hypothetical protein